MAPPETKYARGHYGLIAYQVVGNGPVDLVYLTGATSHVDVRWDSPAFAKYLDRLASFSRLISLDRLGTGASDRVATDVPATWEEWADDLHVVLDAAGSEQAAILAVLDAGPMAMLFAATNPERTAALVLGNTTARVLADDDYPEGMPPDAGEFMLSAIEGGWGTEGFAAMTAPGFANEPDRRAWLAKYMRASMSPAAVAAQYRSMVEVDVRWVLPTLHVPTLVLQRRDFQIGPPHGHYLAEHIPGAKYVELPGSDSMITGDDVGLDTIQEFLTGTRPGPEPDRVLATVLFTDIVGSTQHLSRIGDREWRTLLNDYDAIVQRELEHFSGRLVKTTGDGSLATFDGPARAIRCACVVRDAARALGVETRSGLHTGEIEHRGDDITGLAVVIGQRVSALGAEREVLVSSTVKDLVVGSGIEFTEHGEHELKGVPGTWRVYGVTD
jgi:class 3 adenylate cyclase/pimeloyl-ACP methyl ester carboxylesterase